MKLIEACLNVNKDETNQVIFDSNFYQVSRKTKYL